MRSSALNVSRRCFIGSAATSTMAAAIGPLPRASADAQEKPPKKTILSFYCDDTGPYGVGARAFHTFLDYCAEQGIAGELSLILGASGHSMARSSSRVLVGPN